MPACPYCPFRAVDVHRWVGHINEVHALHQAPLPPKTVPKHPPGRPRGRPRKQLVLPGLEPLMKRIRRATNPLDGRGKFPRLAIVNEQTSQCNTCYTYFNIFAYPPRSACPLCKGEDVDPSGF